ncbi:hypothetical protein R1sor_006866 [Riccia sorocarpa]|uniref:Glycine cleavage system H protein n=1 Tax=Riccia sorocarpa TaxID=122646 RepID=A0ABD3HT01_9MARC
MAMRQFAVKAATALRVRCGPASLHAGIPLSFSRAYSQILEGLKYDKEHEWVKVEGDSAVIGITDHAQAQLGDIVFVEVQGAVGDKIAREATFASVESVKAVSDVFAPVSGEILEINKGLTDDPSAVNNDPYAQGWFVKVKLTNPSELDGLMDDKAYKAYTEEDH